MAAFSTSYNLKALSFLILFLETLAADPVSSFSFTEFEKDPKFMSSVALYGNATVVSGGSAVQVSGAGRFMYKKPVSLVEGKPRQLASFSNYFAFSISSESVDGLTFVLVPSGSEGDVFKNSSYLAFPELGKGKFMGIAVEISASKLGRSGGSANYNVAIYVGNSEPAKISNTSAVNMNLIRGEKMHAWIDYQGSSRCLEVRLNQYGHLRPSDPLVWHKIDFSDVLREEEMIVGFSPLKGNTSQTWYMYSWTFILRHFPQWMHSEPVDPKALAKNVKTLTAKPRNDCLLRVLAAMIFGAGCGALTAFVVLYLWTIFGNRRPVVPEEYVAKAVDFEYEKVDIVVDKSIEDGKK